MAEALLGKNLHHWISAIYDQRVATAVRIVLQVVDQGTK